MPLRQGRVGTAAIIVRTLLIGQVAPLGGVSSAIAKRPCVGPRQIGVNGLLGDEQGDRRHHGGPEKALHHYPLDHYARWREEMNAPPAVLDAPGAFGENISTLGMTEHDVCVGDVYAFGSALLQVSQARQPCFKLNLRFGDRRMARNVQQTGRTGWYYRVLRTGVAQSGDALKLEERPHPEWTLARLLHVMFVDTLNREALAEMASLEALSRNWKRTAARRLESKRVEDWTARLRDESDA